MAWNPYQDYKNRAFSSILTTLFPEQTKTLPRILIWSVIFLLDLILVVWGAFYFGLLQFDTYRSQNEAMFGTAGLLSVLFGLFWLQGWLWGQACKLWKKWKTRHDVSL